MAINHVEVAQKMNEYHVMGASVTKIDKGKLFSSHHYGINHAELKQSIDQKSVFNACSISKFATAVLALKLVSDGILFLDHDVNEHLKSWQIPENEFTQRQKVTLRSLLCHQAGFINPQNSFGTYDLIAGKPSMVDLLSGRTPYSLMKAEVMYEPFTDFVYSDVGYCVVELLIKDVVGRSFEEVMSTYIFEPLKMKNSWMVSTPMDVVNQNFVHGHTKDKVVIEGIQSVYPYPAAAGMWCTSEDLAQLLVEVYQLMNGQGKLDIQKNLMLEMITPQGCKSFAGLGVFLDQVNNHVEISSYGWGVGFQTYVPLSLF